MDSANINLHEFYILVGHLKSVKRTGWVLREVGGCCPESVADHMYRMAMMALTLPISNFEDSRNLRRDKLIQLSIVHDVAEAIVGDLIVGRDGLTKEAKHKMESDAIDLMEKLLNSGSYKNDTFKDLWAEYENQSSSEALFVKDLDRYDMILQAFQYEVLHESPNLLQEFFDSTKDKFVFECVKDLVEVIYNERSKFILSSPSNKSTTT